MPVRPLEMRWSDAIHTVLSKAERPLHEQEITREILDSGLKQTQGQTPERTVNYTLNRDPRFRRVGRGLYALAAPRRPNGRHQG